MVGNDGTNTKGHAKCPTNGGTGGGKHQMGTAELIKKKHKGGEGTCSVNILQGNKELLALRPWHSIGCMTKYH